MAVAIAIARSRPRLGPALRGARVPFGSLASLPNLGSLSGLLPH